MFCCFVLGLPRLGLAAQVDRSTPRAQDGLTLLAVVRGDGQGQYRFPVPAGMGFLEGPTGNGAPGGLGLWVKGPAMPNPKPGQPYDMGQPTATARAANGETVSVQAERQNGPQFNSQTPFVPLYLLVLPNGRVVFGYPGSLGLGGYRGGPPPPPKLIPSLTLTVTQRAELKTFPVSFLVPIARQAPPSAVPPFRRPPPLSRPAVSRPMKMPR